jgi:hypothetical protein
VWFATLAPKRLDYGQVALSLESEDIGDSTIRKLHELSILLGPNTALTRG